MTTSSKSSRFGSDFFPSSFTGNLGRSALLLELVEHAEGVAAPAFSIFQVESASSFSVLTAKRSSVELRSLLFRVVLRRSLLALPKSHSKIVLHEDEKKRLRIKFFLVLTRNRSGIEGHGDRLVPPENYFGNIHYLGKRQIFLFFLRLLDR